MTDVEIFDREMIHFGGRLKMPPESPARKTYDEIANKAELLISSARKHLPLLPHIHFDFISNGEINAYAFKSDGRYFIGLTIGTIFMLELVIFRMLSDSSLFHNIGNPSGEANNLPPLTNFVPNAELMCETGLIPNRPKTNPRLYYAAHLIYQTVLFLVGHEIAHITLGHVDYLQSKTGTALIAEMKWHQTDSEALIERQCIEAHADMRSVISGMASLKLNYLTPSLEKRPWADSPVRPGKLIFEWAFGMNSLFRLFGDVLFNSSQLATEAYPPLPLRRAMATVTASGFVITDWNPALKDEAEKALRVAMQYTEFAFATILGEGRSAIGLKDAFSPLGREHHKRLIKYFADGLKEKLAPFAYEAIS